MMRGYLWEDLPREVKAEFSHFSQPVGSLLGFSTVSDNGSFRTSDPAEGMIDPWDWRRHRSTAARTGILPKQPRQAPRVMRTKIALQELREERARRRMEEKMKLPVDREGTTLHFKIHVRENERADGSADTRILSGYLTMNLNPDGETLREIFVRLGKAGSRETFIDSWARQVSNRLQEGCSVEEVFRGEVNARFDDGGIVQGVKGFTSCTSVADLIARIVISRFGAKEAA
jgi:hypothetical protein